MNPDCKNSVSIIESSQADAWRSLITADRSVFASVEYAQIHKQHLPCRPVLLAYRSGDTLVVYPLFLRPVSKLPFSQTTAEETWDGVSPPYTGPLCISQSKGWETAFYDSLQACFRLHRIIAEFAHLHPWNSFSPTTYNGNLCHDRDIVYVDLSLSEEELWRNSFVHACRKNITRARREEVTVFEAQSTDHIYEFHRIYMETMRRNGAQKEYFYAPSYFLNIFSRMKNNSRFMLAHHQGKVIAGTLYLHDDKDIYSFLGGADQDYASFRPTNAVVYETILWARGAGKKRLILGGGYRPDDGIFRFKSTFSPLRASFSTFKQVHDKKAYQDLCRAWASFYKKPVVPDGYFPGYRQIPTE